MRTIQAIKDEIVLAFQANTFLSVLDILMPQSVEGALINVIASIIYTFEALFEAKMAEIQVQADAAEQYVKPWYVANTQAYQHGDTLIWDNDSSRYKYLAVNESAKIVKYIAATPSNIGGVVLKVAKDSGGSPLKLDVLEKAALQGYWNKLKPVGTPLEVRSEDPDLLLFQITIKRDAYIPLNVLQTQVQTAIKDYLKALDFGGIFRATKFVDSIQAVNGVIDVWIDSIQVKPNTGVYNDLVNEYNTYAGYMDLDALSIPNINYIT